MESKKSGQAGIITALIAIILGSFVFVSAALTNSTNEALVIEFNESLNLTLVAVVSGITVNETTVNNITLENQTLENIASTNQSTINETINQTIPSINITPINQSINLTIPIDNSTLIINQTNLTLPINNATLNILLPKIKNLTKIVEDNKFKLNNETEAYLKNIKNKKEVREFIIKFKTSIDEAKLVNITLDRKINRFKLTKITGEIDDIEDLIEDAEIEFLELEQDINLLEEQIPFNVKKVNADNVWNLSNGSGIKVAVLDTGIWQHDDLILAGGVSIVSNNYYDSHGHGTKVAGVIAALLNNEGLVGVAPDVSLYPVKILHGSAGDLSDAIAGVEWVINNNMDIVSMSFGFSSYSQIFKEVLEEAYNNGILLVAASGNEGTDNILYMSKYSTVIAVGAVTENDDLAYFSSYGFEQELVAPGVDINSTSLSNTYSVSSGTSLAAPHVAGVAALIKSYNKSLTNEQIRAKLRNDALDLGQEGKDDIFGYGLVQVNLTSLNFTQANESYFYELFNITNFRLQNESYWFWLNGTGTIDDVDFEEGYYLVNITYNDGSKKSNIYNVSENGNIFILATAIEHFDYYIYDGSSNSDGIAWINDNITVKVTSTTVPTPEGECYWIDGGTNGRLNYCFFDTTTHKNECDSDPDITCGTETNCQVVSTLIDRYREIINYASARTGTSQARIYDDCTTPGSGIEESG
ncbi:MAG TPA: hypothetical protein DCE80_02895, partial [Ignavibacteriales bacterium]|nr:hypothetical protein [Ignavibacteriales bacterium]